MQKITETVLLGFLLMISSTGKSITMYGLSKVENKIFNQPVAAYGSFESDRCTFKKLDVFGNTELANSKVENLSVEGNLVIDQSQVASMTTVLGYLESSHSSFTKIRATTSLITFVASTANEIYFAAASDRVEQVLELSKESKVLQRIVFESGKGKIKVDKSVVLPQTIEGATIVYQ